MYTAILLLPLLGAVIAGFFHRVTGEKMAMWIPTGILFFCCVLSWIAFFTLDPEQPSSIELFRWISSGELEAWWSIRVDRLTTVMLVVVTTVSSLVHMYSIGYMEEDPGKPRFFAYLSFFTFAMLALVTGDNLLQIFFGWEGVGVASYLLIGFWYKKASANAAAIKAFIVNRVGDFGFLLGMFALFYLTGSLMLDDVFADAPQLALLETVFLGYSVNAVELVCVLLFIGAMGKSAQLFLHTWLPDAMEGPTPVSALIHAATMVTAGVFLVCRMSPLFELAPTAVMIVDHHRRLDGVLRRDHRAGAERHQARHRLFDLLAARLHVRRRGRRRLRGGDVPPVHARLLQGAALPRRGLGHPRHAPRAGHAEDGRAARQDPADLLDDGHRHAGDHRRRHSPDGHRLCRLHLQGHHHRDDLCGREPRSAITPSACWWSPPSSPPSIPGG